MISKCLEVRQRLKREYKMLQLGAEIEERLDGLASQILRIQDISPAATYVSGLIVACEELIKGFRTLNSNELRNLILKVEDHTLSQILVGLGIPATSFTDLLASVRQNSQSQSLDIILPKFLTFNFQNSLKNFQQAKIQTINKKPEMAFKDFWLLIGDTFRTFHIDQNNFSKCLAKKELCNQIHEDDNLCIVDLLKLENFLKLFFGKIKDYKFYSKICKVYSEYLHDLDVNLYPKQIRIVVSTLNKVYKGENQTLNIGKEYFVDSAGIKDSPTYRGDRLIIFGKHPQSDIQFPPDEPNIDLVSLLIYNAGNNYYLVDCSKKSYCGTMIFKGKHIPLEQGMLINLAKTILFTVQESSHRQVDVNSENNPNSDRTYQFSNESIVTHSDIKFEFLEGPYINQSFIRTTEVRDNSSNQLGSLHKIGCGGGGEAPDIYIPSEYGISRRHADLIFEDGHWSLVDERSTNGSFLLIKNYSQFVGRQTSTPVELFSERTSENMATLLLSKYTFFIHKID